jgi:serine/threonine protein phosphatase PrpC
VHCFGVFDGHGGSEVAAMAASKFTSFLKKTKHFAEKNYEKALEETFIKLDKWLISD